VAAGALPGVAALGMMLTAVAQPPPKPPLPSYKGQVLAKRPVAYWRLGERKGSPAARDATGNGHQGKYHGKLLFGQPGALKGDKDPSITLEGPKAKGYVEVPAHKDFSVASSGHGLSVEAWLKPTQHTFAGETKDPHVHWLGKGEKDHYEWGLRFSSKASTRPNRISAYIWNAKGGLGAGAYFQDKLPLQKWIHVVATYDPPGKKDAQVRIYKDGAPSKHTAEVRGTFSNGMDGRSNRYHLARKNGRWIVEKVEKVAVS
jgi:hypothetical protein